jgi:hypothetical protein
MRNIGPIGIALLIVAVGAGALIASRAARKPAPTYLTDAGYSPTDMSEHSGWWYWTERKPKSRVLVFRAKDHAKEPITEADDIAGYAVAGDTIAWTARNGKQWSVVRRQGGRDTTVWSGSDSAGAPWLAGDMLVWAITKPGAIKENVTLPALGPQTVLMVSRAGAAPKGVGNLLESGCDVAGVRGDTAYAVCGRSTSGFQTAGYEVSLSNGAARRVFGEDGPAKAIALPSGDLMWTAPSRDSSMPERMSSVRSLSPGKAAVTRGDWLPAYGQLFASGDRVFFGASAGQSGLWPVTTNDELPHQVETPAGYDAAAVGDRSVLLTRWVNKSVTVKLYTWPLP